MAAGGEVMALPSLPVPSLQERRPEAALTPAASAQRLPAGPRGCYNINVKWFLLLKSKYKSLVSTHDMYLLLFGFFYFNIYWKGLCYSIYVVLVSPVACETLFSEDLLRLLSLNFC